MFIQSLIDWRQMKIAPFGIKREKRANAVGVSLNGRLVVVCRSFSPISFFEHRQFISSSDDDGRWCWAKKRRRRRLRSQTILRVKESQNVYFIRALGMTSHRIRNATKCCAKSKQRQERNCGSSSAEWKHGWN